MIDTATKKTLCQQCPERRNFFCKRHGDEWRKIVKHRATCPGWGDETQPPPRFPPVKNLAIVSCHFNPCGFKKPVENCHRYLARIGQPVTLVELSFNGRFEFDSQIRIEGDMARNFMWQKERLINVGLQALPPDVDAVAWIDADAVFQNPHWYEDAKRQLEHFPLVQLYERVDYLGPGGAEVIRKTNSWAYNWNNGLNGKTYGTPGFAWAARREAVPDGIYDKDIIGGGDCHAIAAWIEQRRWVEKQYAGLKAPAADFDAWKRRQLPLVNGQIGYVPGGAYHLYHGTREKRQYGDRLQILRDHNFCISDIRIDQNGAWEWASNKPAFHRDIVGYFMNREEDH
jgi:hypothetical protein